MPQSFLEKPSLCQVALSVGGPATAAWYRAVLGLPDTGGHDGLSGPELGAMLGLPSVTMSMRWLAAARAMTQLEMMSFADPAPRRRTSGGPGFRDLSFQVADRPALIERLRLNGGLKSAEGEAVEAEDPDGNRLFMTASPDVGEAARLSGVNLISADMGRSMRFWREVANADCRELPDGAVLIEGGAFDIRLRATGRARPGDERHCDIGIVNVALRVARRPEFDAIWARVLAGGWRPNGSPMFIGEGGVFYVDDGQGEAVEICLMPPGSEAMFGYRPDDLA